ncbi:hypothetical protein PI124_g1678 [Phytophthora idaei]|nr:hypothetical protein PI125_g1546 [Phytophthora idaei]KAG3173040.1 hypothetical protein PI126_g1063 [Phytophthora idaei]KAG3253758.1 hypothetical protein PI124_g1678 [Phytophthora idaei]
MRVLQVFQRIIGRSPLIVYTRYCMVKWVIQFKPAGGRCVRWGLVLSHWNLVIRKVQKDENDLAAIMGAGITPREHLDEVAESLIPAKGQARKPSVVSVEMLEADYEGIALNYDGAEKTSTKLGSCGCIL